MWSIEHGSSSRSSSSQSGQAAVLISLCLFSLVVFLAMATNMGILVNDRIRMQNTADLTAYAGAFEQARSLNRLTAINHRIYTTAYNIRKGLTCPGTPPDVSPETILNAEPIPCDPWGNPFLGKNRVFPKVPPSCDARLPKAILKVGQIQMNLLAAAFQVENFRAKETSIRAARITAGRNFLGTARPRHSSFFEWRPDSPTFRGTPLIKVTRQRTQFIYATFRIPGQCGCPRGRLFPPKLPKVCIDVIGDDSSEEDETTLDTWWVKENPGPTVYFPARVDGVPWKEFLDVKNGTGGYFGADAVPGPADAGDELWGFAVAKPFAGHVGSNDENGSTERLEFRIKVPIAGDSKSVTDYGFNSFDLADVEDGFVEKYRARMAGIQDTMYEDKSGTDDSREIQPIQLMLADLMRATHQPPEAFRELVAH